MSRLSRWALLVTLAVAPVTGDAQRAGPGGRPGGGRGQSPDQILGQLVIQQLNLTPLQATRLQETNNRFRDRRSALGRDERQVRQSMRDLLCSADTTRGADVAQLIDRWHDLMAQRLTLQQEEQREMSGFLSPYQRARWLAVEERVRTRADQLMGARGRGGPPPDRPDSGRLGGRGGRRGGGPQGGGPPPVADLCGPGQRGADTLRR